MFFVLKDFCLWSVAALGGEVRTCGTCGIRANPVSIIGEARERSPQRAHIQYVLKVHLKACRWFARDACIEHALNERASASASGDFPQTSYS